MTIREKIRKQANAEMKADSNDDLNIKAFAYWVIYITGLKARAQTSCLDSWSADVNALITNDEELEELYARWVFEEGET